MSKKAPDEEDKDCGKDVEGVQTELLHPIYARPKRISLHQLRPQAFAAANSVTSRQANAPLASQQSGSAGRSESEASRHHTLTQMHNHRISEDNDFQFELGMRQRRQAGWASFRSTRQLQQGGSNHKTSNSQQKYCINRDHQHFSRNIFKDCQECHNSSSGGRSSHNRSNSQFYLQTTRNSNFQKMLQAQKQAPRFLLTSNYLLSDSCSNENMRDFQKRGRVGSLEEHELMPQQAMPDQKKNQLPLPPSRLSAVGEQYHLLPGGPTDDHSMTLGEVVRDQKSECDAQDFHSKQDWLRLQPKDEDYFQRQDHMNRSLRSKVTQQCLSEQGDCLNRCQHEHLHPHCLSRPEQHSHDGCSLLDRKHCNTIDAFLKTPICCQQQQDGDCCSDVDFCNGIIHSHCNDHFEIARRHQHFHPCHKMNLHHHCNSDHEMRSLTAIHHCESDGKHSNCQEECLSCIERCDSCALDLSYGDQNKEEDLCTPQKAATSNMNRDSGQGQKQIQTECRRQSFGRSAESQARPVCQGSKVTTGQGLSRRTRRIKRAEPAMKQYSRKGQKLKKKTKEQLVELRSFFAKNNRSKWTRPLVEQLARRVNLDFKSTNKWLWDRQNRIDNAAHARRNRLKNIEQQAATGQPIFKVQNMASKGAPENSQSSMTMTEQLSSAITPSKKFSCELTLLPAPIFKIDVYPSNRIQPKQNN